MEVTSETIQVCVLCLNHQEMCIMSKMKRLIMAWYWQGLHDMMRITIRESRYDFITIHCSTMHTALFNMVHWKCKNRADKEVVMQSR